MVRLSEEDSKLKEQLILIEKKLPDHAELHVGNHNDFIFKSALTGFSVILYRDASLPNGYIIEVYTLKDDMAIIYSGSSTLRYLEDDIRRWMQ